MIDPEVDIPISTLTLQPQIHSDNEIDVLASPSIVADVDCEEVIDRTVLLTFQILKLKGSLFAYGTACLIENPQSNMSQIALALPFANQSSRRHVKASASSLSVPTTFNHSKNNTEDIVASTLLDDTNPSLSGGNSITNRTVSETLARRLSSKYGIHIFVSIDISAFNNNESLQNTVSRLVEMGIAKRVGKCALN